MADHAVILNQGEWVWSGSMTELTSELTDRFLGIWFPEI